MTEIPESAMEEARSVVAKFPYSMSSDPLENRATIVAIALLAAEKRGEERERAYMKTVLREVIQQQKWGEGMPYESMLEHLEERAAIRKGPDQ
jgi:hypothetical protein